MDCGITVAAWIRLGRFDNFPYFCMKVLLLIIFIDDWMKIKLNSNLSNFLFSGTLTRRGHWRQPLEVCWCPVLLWTLSPEWPSCPPLCTLREDSSGGINLSLFKKFWFTNCSILETCMNLFFSRPLLIGGCYYAVFIILFFFNIIFNTEKMNCSLQYWVGKLDVFRPLMRFHFN